MKKATNSKNRGKISKLFPIMQEHLGKSMNLARIKLIALLLEALVKAQTASLVRLANAMDTAADKESNMRRLQRFLACYALDLDLIARMIFSLLPVKSGLVLTMDRTNWKYGQTDINVLLLGVTYKNVAFPLLFRLLPKRGNSNTAERIEIIERFIRLFGKNCIDCLVADREFVGEHWTGYLNGRGIRYYLRIRQNFWIHKPGSGGLVKASWLFSGLKLGEQMFLHKLFLLKGEYVYLAGAKLKNSDGVPELQILICYNRPQEAVDTYKSRWQIETLNRCLKTAGFNLEDTHLTHLERIERLLAVVCIAVVWAYLVGDHRDQCVKPIRILKNGRRAMSVVRYGLMEIESVLQRTCYKDKSDIFKFLSCT